jgi:hypothetical protein
LVPVSLTLAVRKHRSADVTTRLPAQASSPRTGHCRPLDSACTARSALLLGRTTRRKPASRRSACTARYDFCQLTATHTALCRANEPAASQPTPRELRLASSQRFTASQLTRGKRRPASSRHAQLPSANHYKYGPFQGQQFHGRPADATRAPLGFPDRL